MEGLFLAMILSSLFSRLIKIPLLELELQVNRAKHLDFKHKALKMYSLIVGTGTPFTLRYTSVSSAAAILGYDLVYAQIPC